MTYISQPTAEVGESCYDLHLAELSYGCVTENVVYPIVPNGFADHYPGFKWLFHWEYTQHVQTNPYFTNLNLKAIWGYFPLLTMISNEGDQWARDEIYPDGWMGYCASSLWCTVWMYISGQTLKGWLPLFLVPVIRRKATWTCYNLACRYNTFSLSITAPLTFHYCSLNFPLLLPSIFHYCSLNFPLLLPSIFHYCSLNFPLLLPSIFHYCSLNFPLLLPSIFHYCSLNFPLLLPSIFHYCSLNFPLLLP